MQLLAKLFTAPGRATYLRVYYGIGTGYDYQSLWPVILLVWLLEVEDCGGGSVTRGVLCFPI